MDRWLVIHLLIRLPWLLIWRLWPLQAMRPGSAVQPVVEPAMSEIEPDGAVPWFSTELHSVTHYRDPGRVVPFPHSRCFRCPRGQRTRFCSAMPRAPPWCHELTLALFFFIPLIDLEDSVLNEPTLNKLRSMRMHAMADAWLEQQRSPDTATLGFDERFGLLVDTEYLDRENRRLTRRLYEAKLRHSQACVENFEQPDKRGVNKSLVKKLATCQWIADHLNVVITGSTGVGKTYLVCALGQHACRKGYRVLYRRSSRLIDELMLARADGSLPKLLSRFARVDLLILDDWGMTPLRDQDRRDLFEIIEDRDGSRSTMVASQIPITKWHDYLGDPTVADAIADRILHSAHRIALKGPSRRKERKKKPSTSE